MKFCYLVYFCIVTETRYIFIYFNIIYFDNVFVLIFGKIKYKQKFVRFLLCMFSFFVTSNIHFLLSSHIFPWKQFYLSFTVRNISGNLRFLGVCLVFLTYLLFPLNFLNPLCLPSRNLLLQSQQCKHQYNLYYFDKTYYFDTSIVDFEQVNRVWVLTIYWYNYLILLTKVNEYPWQLHSF